MDFVRVCFMVEEVATIGDKPNLFMKKTDHQEDEIRNFFKKWPNLYYFIVYLFGPIYFGGLNSPEFFKKYHKNGQKINLGSGPRRISNDVINVDFEKFEGVDVVADITKLPFKDNSVSMIVCDTVLEHVNDPIKAVSEMYRVLEPSGFVYISVPFLYPFHPSPSDYNRWTEQGLKYLLKDFEPIELGTRSGIFSTFSVMLCYSLPALFSFGSNTLYLLLSNLSLFIFFPIKFLDIIANRLPFSTKTASVLYIVARK